MAKQAQEQQMEVEAVKKQGLDKLAGVRQEHLMENEAQEKVHNSRVEEKERILERLNQQQL